MQESNKFRREGETHGSRKLLRKNFIINSDSRAVCSLFKVFMFFLITKRQPKTAESKEKLEIKLTVIVLTSFTHRSFIKVLKKFIGIIMVK